MNIKTSQIRKLYNFNLKQIKDKKPSYKSFRTQDIYATHYNWLSGLIVPRKGLLAITSGKYIIAINIDSDASEGSYKPVKDGEHLVAGIKCCDQGIVRKESNKTIVNYVKAKSHIVTNLSEDPYIVDDSYAERLVSLSSITQILDVFSDDQKTSLEVYWDKDYTLHVVSKDVFHLVFMPMRKDDKK